MRDDSHRWDAPRTHAAKGLITRQVDVGGQHLVSGPKVQKQYADVLIGWPDVPRAERYALSLRRDRVLLVGGCDLADGFDAAANVAVTDISDGFDVIDLIGPGAIACLQRGAELRTDQTSRSVARLVFGIGVYLYAAPGGDGLRVHTPRAMTTAFMQHVAEASAH